MLLDRGSRPPFDALFDHADGPRRRSRVRGPPPLRHRALTTSSRFCCCPMNEGEA
jgi:hypothetical protein